MMLKDDMLSIINENHDNIHDAVDALNTFTHNFCMDISQTKFTGDLVFRCGQCPFNRCRQLVAKGLREFRKRRNAEFLMGGVREVYEKEVADATRKNLEIGKIEVLVELLELLNNKAVTIETLRNIYIENRECANPFLDMTIDEFADEFKLSIRTYNCIIRAFGYTRTAKEHTPEEIVKLRRRGISDDNAHWSIHTVRDLAMMTDDEIRNIRNLGQKSYMELIHAMKLAGITPKPADADVD